MSEDTKQWAIELLNEENPDAIFFNGLDEAIIGVGAVQHGDAIVVYSEDEIIRILMQRDDMEEEDAWDYYSYNIRGAYLGENTPIIVRTPLARD